MTAAQKRPLHHPSAGSGQARRGDTARRSRNQNPSPQRTQGAQRTQGKAQARGCFSEPKSSQAAKTFRISTAEVAEEAEVLGGCNVGPTFSSPVRLLLSSRQYSQKTS